MRSSLPARSSKARATAVMASTPPRRSYREPSTVPTSCALVTNGPTVFPASHILKRCNRRRVNLYLLLTDGKAAASGRRTTARNSSCQARVSLRHLAAGPPRTGGYGRPSWPIGRWPCLRRLGARELPGRCTGLTQRDQPRYSQPRAEPPDRYSRSGRWQSLARRIVLMLPGLVCAEDGPWSRAGQRCSGGRMLGRDDPHFGRGLCRGHQGPPVRGPRAAARSSQRRSALVGGVRLPSASAAAPAQSGLAAGEGGRVRHQLRAAPALVGRDFELAELLAGLDDAACGTGRLFLLAGDPGIGKSRLAGEAAARARVRGVKVVWGRCWEAGGAPAYWPWVQALRAVV